MLNQTTCTSMYPCFRFDVHNSKTINQNMKISLCVNMDPYNLVALVQVSSLCVCIDKMNRHTSETRAKKGATASEREFIVRLGKPKTTMCWLISLLIGGCIGCFTYFFLYVCVLLLFFPNRFAFGALLTINYRLCQSNRKKWEVMVFFFFAFAKRSKTIRKP